MNKQELIADIESESYMALMAQRRPFTFCMLQYGYANQDYIGYGFSMVCYPDDWDAELGKLKAKKRAVADVWRQIKADNSVIVRTETITAGRHG